MRTQSAFILWTATVLHLSVIKGQTTDSSPSLLNEVLPEDHMTTERYILESGPSTASPPPTDSSSGEVTPSAAPPSQPSNDSSPSPAISQTPALRDVTTNTDTASAPGFSVGGSSSLSYVKSTISDPAATAPATSISPSEGHQTFSTSTSSASQSTQTSPPSTPSYPQTSQFALTSSSEVTAPAPSEDQDKPSELDVGDQESGKAPHRPTSPLDPLLAALVTIFIICTAMVSAVLFLRFRQRNEHPEFHRLQDLPMDDLLEDTPLSRYTY